MLSSQASALEEYKALRAEVIALFARQETRLTVAWAGVAGLLGIAAISRLPELGCLALALVASAWRDHQELGDGVLRLGAYIEVVLEPTIPGLRWQTVFGRIRAGQSIGRSPVQRIWSSVSST